MFWPLNPRVEFGLGSPSSRLQDVVDPPIVAEEAGALSGRHFFDPVGRHELFALPLPVRAAQTGRAGPCPRAAGSGPSRRIRALSRRLGSRRNASCRAARKPWPRRSPRASPHCGAQHGGRKDRVDVHVLEDLAGLQQRLRSRRELQPVRRFIIDRIVRRVEVVIEPGRHGEDVPKLDLSLVGDGVLEIGAIKRR